MGPAVFAQGSSLDPPKYQLRATLQRMRYSIRSERLPVKFLAFDVLFRWLVGRGTDDAVSDELTFAKNRARLLNAALARINSGGKVDHLTGCDLALDDRAKLYRSCHVPFVFDRIEGREGCSQWNSMPGYDVR